MSTQIYAPSVRIALAGSALDPDVAADVLEVVVTDELGGIGEAVVTLVNAFPELRYTHGDDAAVFVEGGLLTVALGYVDQTSQVFDGQIVGIDATFPDDGAPTVTVTAYTRLHLLSAPTRRRTFEQMSDEDIVRLVAGDNGLTPDVTTDVAVTYESVAQHSEDDLSFLRRRARRIRHEVAADGTTLRFRPAQDTQPATATLVWGDAQLTAAATGPTAALHRFEARLSPRRAVDRARVVGTDPSSGEAIAGVAAAAAGAAAGAGTPAADVVSQAFGGDRGVTVVDEPVESQSEADALAQALFDTRNGDLVRAGGTAVGLADLAPGITVQVLGVGRRFSGPYYLTSVRHAVTLRGFTSSFEARRAAVGEPS